MVKILGDKCVNICAMCIRKFVACFAARKSHKLTTKLTLPGDITNKHIHGICEWIWWRFYIYAQFHLINAIIRLLLSLFEHSMENGMFSRVFMNDRRATTTKKSASAFPLQHCRLKLCAECFHMNISDDEYRLYYTENKKLHNIHWTWNCVLVFMAHFVCKLSRSRSLCFDDWIKSSCSVDFLFVYVHLDGEASYVSKESSFIAKFH